MENKIFIVNRIEGEYAYIRNYDNNSSDEIFIALALLPLGADVGTRLICNGLEFCFAD